MHGGTDVRTLSTSTRGSADRKWAGKENIAVQYKSKRKWDILFGKVTSGGVASPILTVLHGCVGRRGGVRWVGGCRGIGGVAGVGRREDSPRLRVFLSNNNVIRIIHPRIPVTEESLSVNTGS